MNHHPIHWSVAIAVLAILAACGRSPDDASAGGDAAPTAAEPTVAAPAPATSSAATGEAPSAPGAAAETAPAGSDAAAVAVNPEVAQKQREVAAALAEDQIVSDTQGQWATTAKASSTYNDAKDPASYSASQVTGAPNVEKFGDNGSAWCPKTADGGIERLEVGFAKPVQATEIRVRQNVGPGAIIKVDLIDDGGKNHTVYEGVDTVTYDALSFWFRKSFDKTAYKVVGAKLTLATNAVSGWNEIDAVQLIGE